MLCDVIRPSLSTNFFLQFQSSGEPHTTTKPSKMHLVSPASLPNLAADIPSLSILSYNVLLPNSVDGWWTYKMYSPPLTKETHYQSTWEYRSSLIQERLKTIQADVVCFQEVAPDSFLQDFAFMQDLGYDEMEIFQKGRFRPATFWKSSQCQLAAPAAHKDRCLLTAFQVHGDENRHFVVGNCHLQAGKQGPRRLRQIHEAARGAMTLVRRLTGTVSLVFSSLTISCSATQTVQ